MALILTDMIWLVAQLILMRKAFRKFHKPEATNKKGCHFLKLFDWIEFLIELNFWLNWFFFVTQGWIFTFSGTGNFDNKLLYSVSLSFGSDVVCLIAKRSVKSRALAHIGSRAHKNKECVHALTSCVCVLTSLPEDGETEYSTNSLLPAHYEYN